MNVRPELATTAATWVVRLAAEGDAGLADWEAFSAWLNSDQDARTAYDRALDIWLTPPVVAAPAAPRPIAQASSRRWAIAASLAAAAVITGAGALALFGKGSGEVLETKRGERHSFILADGTRLTLDQDSKVVVEFRTRRRRVVIQRGDVGFDVAKQALAPLRVIVGDDALTGGATQFGVHRRDGRLKVVVRQGGLAVGPAVGVEGPRVNLTTGSVLDHIEGTQTFQVGAADPERAFRW